MNAIGGFFGLELSSGTEYHSKAIALNTGRNALEFIMRARKYKKVYVPYYTCDAVLEPVNLLNIEFEFYRIDQSLEPLIDLSLVKLNEGFIYTNYFGLKDSFVARINKLCSTLIVDNAQAFFADPVKGIDTFYSPRKFFGVPDGGYLYTNSDLPEPLEMARSYRRFEHLLRRIDNEAEDGYSFFIENEKSLAGQPLQKMSSATHALLGSIDYERIAMERRRNFQFLHSQLGSANELNLPLEGKSVPMTYPFLTRAGNLREELRRHKIYTAQYWPNVLEWADTNSVEYQFASRLIHLPIDQRLSNGDYGRLIEIVRSATVSDSSRC